MTTELHTPAIPSIATGPTSTKPKANRGARPLCAGDRLSLDEFIRVWEQHPEIKRAELIEGIVYMPPPLSREHGNYDMTLHGVSWLYVSETLGVEGNSNASTFLVGEMPQPDLHLRIQHGGASRIVEKYIHGPPELVAEVCASSASYDANQKRKLYESAQVQEYLMILVHEEEIRWTELVNGTYRDLAPSVDGVWKSHVFPGLWLHEEAFWTGDFAKLRATVHEGLASPEHRAFVEQLAARNSPAGGTP